MNSKFDYSNYWTDNASKVSKLFYIKYNLYKRNPSRNLYLNLKDLSLTIDEISKLPLHLTDQRNIEKWSKKLMQLSVNSLLCTK